MVGREVLVGGTIAIATLFFGMVRFDVNWWGKVATFLLYGSIASFYFEAADVLRWMFVPPAWIAGVVGLVLYYWVGADYLAEVRRSVSSLESPDTQQEV